MFDLRSSIVKSILYCNLHGLDIFFLAKKIENYVVLHWVRNSTILVKLFGTNAVPKWIT